MSQSEEIKAIRKLMDILTPITDLPLTNNYYSCYKCKQRQRARIKEVPLGKKGKRIVLFCSECGSTLMCTYSQGYSDYI